MTRSHKRLITSKKKRLFVSYLVMKVLKVKLRKEIEKTTFFLAAIVFLGIIRENSGNRELCTFFNFLLWNYCGYD